jgi:diguanylate cyclase (GGDEF)-like protein
MILEQEQGVSLVNENFHTLKPNRTLVFIGLYLLLCYLSVAFIKSPDEVALMWPASGLALGYMIRYGLAWCIPLAVSVLLMHIFIDPLPVVFVAFSVLSNVIGAATAFYFIRFRHPKNLLSMQAGLNLVVAALLMSVVSGIIGIMGMRLAGMLESDAMWPGLLQWVLANLSGIICTGPATLLLTSTASGDPDTPQSTEYSGLRSRIYWTLLFIFSLILIFNGGHSTSPYVLGLAMLPMALVLWSAIRFPPVWTATANAVAVLSITSMIGLGLGGFKVPKELFDIVYLLVFLSLLGIFPMMMLASNHESRKAARKLFRRATTDADTGLPNRIAFEEAATNIMQMNGPETTLAYLDFDHFSLVNDTVSHAAGDVLINAISSLLQANLYPDEKLFRIGGDEFAILLPLNDKLAERRSKQLLLAIESFRTGWNGNVLSTTASIGLAKLTPGQSSFAVALSNADAACFTAKELGGNRICIADHQTEIVMAHTESMQWAVRIRSALSRGDFELFCQEIRSFKSEGRHGREIEILLRLRDRDSGAIFSPALFMPSVERFDLGTRIDRHVIELVFDWMESHLDEAQSISSCSINLTAATMQDQGFTDFLRGRLARSSFPASKIIFEITETSAVTNLGHAQTMIAELRRLGCRFSLDDFGSGFCSFQYLQNLEVDVFKIDGSFVRDLQTSELSKSVIRAITDIASVLNKVTVAEQCESGYQLAILEELGVDKAQGFIIHQPEAISDFFKNDR